MKKVGCALAGVALIFFFSCAVLAFSTEARATLFGHGCRAVEKADVGVDKDHCLKAVAVFLKSRPMCQQITGEKFVTEYEGVKFQLENPPQMQCLTEVAVEENDPYICIHYVSGVLIANTKIDCLYEVAAKNNNPRACEMIEDDEQSRMGETMNQAGCLAQLEKK